MVTWTRILLAGLVIVLLTLVFSVFDGGRESAVTPILSFEQCVKQTGVTLSDLVPHTCTTSDGRIFTEELGNESQLLDVIRITTPRPNSRVFSPMVVEGFARGAWFFEGQFLVTLTDDHGEVVSTAPAYAQKAWTTKDFVPFRASLVFKGKHTGPALLTLSKDNPSGDPAREQQLKMLLHFPTMLNMSTSTNTQ